MKAKTMDVGKKKLHERMSVSLDLESVELVEKLQTEYQTSKSEIVRKALNYLNVVTEEGRLSPEKLKSIIKLSARPDTVIIDLSLIEAIVEELGEGSEKFKEDLRNIGYEIYREYCDMGIRSPSECLKTIEKTNLFDVAADSENSFTLVSVNQKIDKILKEFLEGLLQDYSQEIEVKAEHGKIRITTKEKESETKK